MKKRKNNAARRAEQAIERALKSIEEAGWTMFIVQPFATVRYVAKKRRFEREDDSVTLLFESDFTVEGLAANVARREREEAFTRGERS